MARTVIVVPCYNEAERLKVATFRRFVADCDDLSFLFVNDGSRDDTLEILNELSRKDPRHFDVLNLSVNSGKGEAVRQGMRAALSTDAAFVGYWDADLATPLEAIPLFRDVFARCPEIGIVVGTRIPLLGRAIHRQTQRKWLGRLFANVASLALGTRIYDTQCGAKLFRATPEIASVLNEPFASKWVFDVEIFARLIHAQRGTASPPIPRQMYELPLDHWEDVAGSRVKPFDFVQAALDLATIYLRYLRPGLPPNVRPVSSGDAVVEAPRRAA